MLWFLSACLWIAMMLVQFLAGLLFRALAMAFWLFWPAVVLAMFVASAQSAEAGWFSWLWGSDTRQLERSLDVAQEAARVASEASQAQAQQAAAQADQNARLAETLGQLSSERANLADHLHALSELSLRDSQWAAAISASGPVLICVTVLLVAGMALWLANKPRAGQHAELAETVDLLVDEMAVNITEPQEGIRGQTWGYSRLGYQQSGQRRLGHGTLGHDAISALIGEAQDPGATGDSDEEDEAPAPF